MAKRIKKIKNIAPDPAPANKNDFKLSLAQLNSDIPVCDLHGCNVAEALFELDIFLDKAFRNNWEVVKIIHGKGQGILASEVKNFLNQHTFVINCKISDNLPEIGAVIYALIRTIKK